MPGSGRGFFGALRYVALFLGLHTGRDGFVRVASLFTGSEPEPGGGGRGDTKPEQSGGRGRLRGNDWRQPRLQHERLFAARTVYGYRVTLLDRGGTP